MNNIIIAINNFRSTTGRNIVICGPKMGEDCYEKRSKKLRVYSYGGLIAEFGYSATERQSIFLLNKEYYQDNRYIDGEGLQYLKKLPVMEKKTVMLDYKYWEYASLAAQSRYSKDDVPKERNIESRILEKYINCNDLQFSIFDMEFSATASWKENYGIEGKPDLICFDGRQFGLIELKYNNQACDGESGLNKHYNDLRKTCNKRQPELIDELKRRVALCNGYETPIMNRKICEKIEKVNADDEIWFGFLFVNDDESNPLDKIKKSQIDNQTRIMCVKNLDEIKSWNWTTRVELGIPLK